MKTQEKFVATKEKQLLAKENELQQKEQQIEARIRDLEGLYLCLIIRIIDMNVHNSDISADFICYK